MLVVWVFFIAALYKMITHYKMSNIAPSYQEGGSFPAAVIS